jgi:hypothetical protein
MSENSPASVTVEVQCYGLGYPPGYRPLSVDTRFDWKGTPIYITIETLKDHHEHWHTDGKDVDPIFSHPGTCETGLLQPTYRDEDNMYSVIFDTEEIITEDLKHAVEMFFNVQGVNPNEIDFTWPHSTRALEDERQVWKEYHDRYLAWLRRGAPPYKVAWDDSAVDDILAIAGKTTEGEDDLMEGMGFQRDDKGTWKREPDLVVNEPREWYVDALREFARTIADPGPLFLSSGSWPTSIAFVANGKRYETERKKDFERAWYAYLPHAHHVVLLRSRSDVEVITIEGEPDICPALESVSSV